jgi:TRAP-type transport system periplasmic protein
MSLSTSKIFSKITPFVVGIAASTFTLLCAAQTKWDLPTGYPPANFHTENLMQFSADVDKATAGQLKITIHPSASLFKGPEIKRAVQNGQAQAGEILLANYENESPIFGVDGIPFLATGYRNAKALYVAQKPALQDYLDKQGLMLLYSVAWPPQGLYSKKKLESIVDMRNAKWRAYSPATARMGELMGAQSVSIQSAELNQALSTGAVESFASSGATGIDSRAYEFIKNYYDLEAWLPKNAVLVNTKAFAALDKSQQAAVINAAKAAEERGWRASVERNESTKNVLISKGVTVHQGSSKLVSDMRQLGWTMLQDWQKRAGPDGVSVIDSYTKGPSKKFSTEPNQPASGPAKSKAKNKP